MSEQESNSATSGSATWVRRWPSGSSTGPVGVSVFDVRAEAMTPLAEVGASLADSVADVADADVISVTVLNDEQVRDVVGELAAPRQAWHGHRDPLHDQPGTGRRARR